MSWVCWLSPTWHNIDCSQLMCQFDCCQLQLVYLTVECCPARNLQHKASQTSFDLFSQSQHLLHTLHKSFFLHFSCIFTFLEIIKHNMPKALRIFFYLQIKMATPKFINFDVFFSILFIFKQKGREGERVGEKHQCLVASHMPHTREPGPHVPRLGIEPATLWFTGQCSIHWATPARANFWCFLSTHWCDSCHNII